MTSPNELFDLQQTHTVDRATIVIRTITTLIYATHISMMTVMTQYLTCCYSDDFDDGRSLLIGRKIAPPWYSPVHIPTV